MPTSWDTCKSKLDWLCLDESKAIEEDRGILKSYRRPYTPTRSHRTWKGVGEWTVQKHRKKRGLSPDKRLIEAAMVVGTSSTKSSPRMTSPVLRFGQDITVPSHPMEAVDVLAFIRGCPSVAFHALEILLTKWQPGGEYLKVLVTALKIPEYCEPIIRLASDGRPLLFDLIEKHVPREEQLAAGKLLLGAHLTFHRTPLCYNSHWLMAWVTACHCTEWDEANEVLYRGNSVATLAGDVFLNSARAAIAERMLRRYIQHFRAWKANRGWLNETELHNAEVCRQKYLVILEECRDANLTLQPSFYRDSLEIIETQYPLVDNQQQARSIDLAEECRHKYIQLTSDFGCTMGDRPDVEEGELVKAPRQDTPSSAQGSRSPDIRSSIEVMGSPIARSDTEAASSIGESEGSSNLRTERGIVANYNKSCPPTPNMTMNDLIESWLHLSGFSTYVHYILQGGGTDISIFDPERPGTDNLFDLIHVHVPTHQQIPLTKDILVAFSTAHVDVCRYPSALAWWLTLFSAPSWKEFEYRLEPQQSDVHLKPAMSAGAVQLVLDATMLLVGERLLGELKDEIAASQGWKAIGSNSIKYHATFGQFMDILGELQKRDLSVDGAWRSHLLNMM